MRLPHMLPLLAMLAVAVPAAAAGAVTITITIIITVTADTTTGATARRLLLYILGWPRAIDLW